MLCVMHAVSWLSSPASPLGTAANTVYQYKLALIHSNINVTPVAKNQETTHYHSYISVHTVALAKEGVEPLQPKLPPTAATVALHIAQLANDSFSAQQHPAYKPLAGCM